MEKSAFIIPVTRNYLVKCKTLLRSIAVNSDIKDVHVLTPDLDRLDFIEFCDKLNLTVAKAQYHVNQDLDHPEFRMVRTYRFTYAKVLGDNGYTSVCLLDADMVLVRDITMFFMMAQTGAIMVSNNNTLLKYTPEYFKKHYVDCDMTIVHPTFCTVPLILNPIIHKEFLLNVWNNQSGNDLEVPNVVAVALGLSKKLHYLNSYSWTNIHHSMLKPELAVKKATTGELFSGQCEPLYVLHGHWNEAKYVEDLIKPIIKNYSHVPKAVMGAKNAIITLKKEYDKYTGGI